MAAANDPQVSRCDSEWYRSDVANETNETRDLNDYQGNHSETDGNEADAGSNFVDVINELQLDTNRGSAEFDVNDADDISPAIQISKTFSLASLDTSTCCSEKLPSSQSNTSPTQSYNLTDLDNECKSTGNKNTSLPLNSTLCQTHKSGPMTENVKQDDHAKQVLTTYKRKTAITKKPIECHVIDLETFSTSRTSSTTKVEQKNMTTKNCGQSSVKPYSIAPDHKYSMQMQTIFLDEDTHGLDKVYSGANQNEPQSFNDNRPNFIDSDKLRSDNVNLSDANCDDGINSFYLHDVGNGSFEYICNLDQIGAENAEDEITSNLVIDLNDRLPDDSGIFEASLSGKNNLSNFDDSHLVVSSSRGHSKYTCSPKRKDVITLDSAYSDGGHRDHISFLHKQTEDTTRTYQRNMAYHVPHSAKQEDIFYDGMKTLRDPYVMDECSYMYRPHYNSPFLYNRVIPCNNWESTYSQKNQNPVFTSVIDESTQNPWCSESFADFFDSRNPSEIAQYSQLSAIKDEEETDDADETGFMAETSDPSSNHWGPRPDYLSNYFFTDNSDVNRCTSATLTPPPSEASTPDPLSSLYTDMSTHQWGPSSTYSFPDYVSLETSTAVGPFQQPNLQTPYIGLKPDYLDSNFLNQGSQRGIPRSFPTMADHAIYSGYSCSPSKLSISEPAIKKTEICSKRRGKPRKSQIQSAKISTSTPKNPIGNGTKPEPTPGNNFIHQASEIFTKSKTHPKTTKTTTVDRMPRHNEPLKQIAVDVMTKWYEENIHNPYPTKAQKTAMAQEGHISENQVKSWFANKRNRTHNTKPKVHKRAMEEKLKELFQDLKNTNPTQPTDNSHIMQQLSGIIQHCHMKLD